MDFSENSSQLLTVVLEEASLNLAKINGKKVLLRVDKHFDYLMQTNTPLSSARPDILHQSLLALIDSPLNKEGKLQVLVRSESGLLIEVSSQIRLPRTLERFCGLFAGLLESKEIRTEGGKGEVLLKIRPEKSALALIPKGVKSYLVLPGQEEIVPASKIASEVIKDGQRVVIFIPVTSENEMGKELKGRVDSVISLTETTMTSTITCNRICSAFEAELDIL